MIKVVDQCNEKSFKNLYLRDLASDISFNKDPFLIIRCDIEFDPTNAFLFAKMLKKQNIKATFHFRIDTAYDRKIMLKIQEIEHEVGIHQNCLDQSKGNFAEARKIFINNIKKIRSEGIQLHTVSEHSELLLSNKYYYRNNDLFKKFPELLDETKVKEAYLTYDSIKKNINFVGDNLCRIKKLLSQVSQHNAKNNLHILFHPHRWRWKKTESMYWVIKDIMRGCYHGIKSPITASRRIYTRLQKLD